jgi:hypothetical protein
MDIELDLGNSWGRRSDHHDVRAMRRYNVLLRKLATVGECVVYLLAVLSAALFLWFLYFGNFENVIFTDGTDLTCVLNGSTGEIVHGK